MENLSFAARVVPLLGLVAVLSACGTLKPEPQRPVVAQVNSAQEQEVKPVAPQAAPQAPAQSAPNRTTVAELQALIRENKVQELRTAYNGKYGASMLFAPGTLTYYVVLFQQQDFWRVFKSADSQRAERTFTQFRQDTVAYAAADLRRITLQAEVSQTERELEQKADELSVLQNDLALQRQQEAVAAAQQEQARREANELAEQRAQANKQLRELQRQIEALEKQRSALLERQQR